MIQRFFEDKPGYVIEFLMLTGDFGVAGETLAARIAAGGLSGVIAAGGDGTVKMVATYLLHTAIPLGILPAGSANGMARDLGLPEDWDAALTLITQAVTRTIDVICINGRDISIHLSDIGLNALLVKYFEHAGVRGKLGYVRVVFKTFYSRQLFTVDIDNGVEKLRRQAFMIVLANAGKYGTGACINPQSDLSDGIFEVVLVKKISLMEILKMLFIHRPFNPHKTEIIRARKVTISTRKKAEFQIDGEYMGKITDLTAEIIPLSLKIFTPVATE